MVINHLDKGRVEMSGLVAYKSIYNVGYDHANWK